MHVDYIVAGQGIAGTLLSYELMQAGKTVMVIDQPNDRRASLVAGAVINPLSGKAYNPAQDADRFIPLALKTYKALETLLGNVLLEQKKLYVFPEKEEQALAFEQARLNDANTQLQWMPAKDYADWDNLFTAQQGIGIQEPLWQVAAAELLSRWRDHLIQRNAYRAASLNYDVLNVKGEQVVYEDITAKGIIFCEGAAAATNPFLKMLPFTRNRGDVLLVSVPGLPAQIYHRGLRLVPRAGGVFWCGSNYRWNFDNLEPDEHWREAARTALHQWLKLPFTIEQHLVAERPTTAGQVPLVGLHPQNKNIAVLNGLGTRGFSSGPYWAAQLCRLLLQNDYVIPGYSKAWLDKQFSR